MTEQFTWPDCPLCGGRPKVHFYTVKGIGIYSCTCEHYNRPQRHEQQVFGCPICALVQERKKRYAYEDPFKEDDRIIAELRDEGRFPPEIVAVEQGVPI